MSSVDWSGWAGNILSCVEDTTTPTGSVVCFLQTSLGVLNAKLGTCYYISGDADEFVEPSMGNMESGILTEMYICNNYRKIAMKNIGAAGCEVLEIEDPDGGKIRIASKTQAAQVARGLHKDCCECLEDLIKWYKKSVIANPQQVLYNERTGNDNGIGCPIICPPDGSYSSMNYIFN